jgi:hypothetical protein
VRVGAFIFFIAACESSNVNVPSHRYDLQFAPSDEDMAIAADLSAGVDLSGAASSDLSAGEDLAIPADLSTPSGDLGNSASCKTLLQATPGLPSGTYTINPAVGGSRNVYCDMTTDGGGWTMVFKAGTSNYDTDFVDYDIATTSSLWSDATDVLLAQRNAANGVVGDWARFTLPADWRAKAPFQYDGQDLTLPVVVSGAAPVSRTLRYGRFNFAALCTDDWDATFDWGRVCIENTTAPFYDGFDNLSADGCQDSSQGYGSTACSVSLLFSIAIR